MARQCVEIGSSPSDEDCVQVGDPDYHRKATAECRRFIDLIRRRLGPEPEGARLRIRSNPHDFGTYLEVVCDFDDALPASVGYAFACESSAPTRWTDERTMRELTDKRTTLSNGVDVTVRTFTYVDGHAPTFFVVRFDDSYTLELTLDDMFRLKSLLLAAGQQKPA